MAKYVNFVLVAFIGMVMANGTLSLDAACTDNAECATMCCKASETNPMERRFLEGEANMKCMAEEMCADESMESIAMIRMLKIFRLLSPVCVALSVLLLVCFCCMRSKYLKKIKSLEDQIEAMQSGKAGTGLVEMKATTMS